MDNIDIRSYIKENFKNSDEKEIKDSIEASINEKDDVTLPGLGVFFEIFWENATLDEKNKTLEILKNNL